MNTWYVYLLLCDQKIFYTGITKDIKERLDLHRNKESIFTKQFSDLEVVYVEKYESKQEAAKREKQIKGWNKTKKQMLVDGKLGHNVCTKEIRLALGLPKYWQG